MTQPPASCRTSAQNLRGEYETTPAAAADRFADGTPSWPGSTIVRVMLAVASGWAVPALLTAQSPSASPRPLLASDSGPAVQAVLTRGFELTNAFVRRDSTALDAIIDAEALQVTASGVSTKREWIAPFLSGDKRFGATPTSSWRRVRVYGDLAVVTSASTLPMRTDGRDTSFHTITTRVWVREDGAWRVLLAQNTPAGGQVSAANGARSHEPAPPNAEPRSAREAEVLAANDRVERLDLEPDSITATRSYAADFLNVTLNGDVRGKVDRIAALLRGQPQYERIVDSELQARVVGDAALVSGRSLVRARVQGSEREGPVRFLRVFVRRGADWQLVMQQLTRVP